MISSDTASCASSPGPPAETDRVNACVVAQMDAPLKLPATCSFASPISCIVEAVGRCAQSRKAASPQRRSPQNRTNYRGHDRPAQSADCRARPPDRRLHRPRSEPVPTCASVERRRTTTPRHLQRHDSKATAYRPRMIFTLTPPKVL